MTLKVLGVANCQYCGELATVGRSRDGTGAAIHLMCDNCEINLQTRRSSHLGRGLEMAAATRNPGARRWHSGGDDTEPPVDVLRPPLAVQELQKRRSHGDKLSPQEEAWVRDWFAGGVTFDSP